MNAIPKKPIILVLSVSSMAVAEEIRALTGGQIHGLRGRVNGSDVMFDNTAHHVGQLFQAGQTIIGVMATGALIRLIAPHIRDKLSDPAVLSVADDGSTVVPLLGGHHGSNQMARVIAAQIGGTAAITTAGDVRFGVALDEPPAGWKLANPENAKPVMAALLGGAQVQLIGDLIDKADWLKDTNLPVSDTGDVKLSVNRTKLEAAELQLVYHPQNLIMGVGCERGCDGDELIKLAKQSLNTAGLSKGSLACIASLDVKADEEAVHELAKYFGVPAKYFNAAALEAETPRLVNPSDIVFKEVGCHGVCEGAALAGVGATGSLVVEKQKSKRATVAFAQSSAPFAIADIGRNRGHLSVVGIGPGSDEWRSPEVTRLISEASDLVGYSLYLDLLNDLTKGKTRHDFDLGKEEDRVRHAMELAGEGNNVALVCSGDAGIYAMATLVYELLEDGGLSDGARRIAIQVSPGISALQAAAARAGAPLGHDFCTISLSDLLTPWPSIQMRVKAAAEGDFVIAFYNPVSKRRRTQLAYAKEVLLEHRPADTPVILATNLGREGELIRIVPLKELKIKDVDMLTVVIVGSSDTRTIKTGDGKSWVYTPRGYAAKQGTKIGHKA